MNTKISEKTAESVLKTEFSGNVSPETLITTYTCRLRCVLIGHDLSEHRYENLEINKV
jgi:hypothetical protein